jgi:putative aminopeptidase FrvX
MDKLTALKDVLRVQSYSHAQWRMFSYIIRYISKIPNTVYHVDDGNIYITKGLHTSYPCVVAHMDTVHPITEDLSLLQIGDNITGFNTISRTQTGVGGDDKVGIFIALQCLLEFDNIKIAFFRDEEVGCQGSYNAEMQFFDDVNFVLQCDRRGNGDFITSASGVSLSSKAFQKAIKNTIRSYGYNFASGMMTDVMALKEEGLPVSCANISCGYYNPHSENEYVNISDVMNCLDMVVEIIDSIGHEKFEHTYTSYTTTKKKNWWESNKDGFDFSWDISSREKMSWCEECGTYENKEKLTNGYCNFCLPMHTQNETHDRCWGCDEYKKLQYDIQYGVMMCDSCATSHHSVYSSR